MKKFILTFILIFVMITFYTFFIPVRVHFVDIYEVKRAFSTVSIGNESSSVKDDPDGYYFTDNSVGYFNTDGFMIYRYDCPDKQYLTANIYGFITYKDDDNSANVFSHSGKESLSIGTTQIPYFAGDLPYFYCIHRDGLGFSMYSLNGQRLYDTIEYSSMITTINHNLNPSDLMTIVSDTSGATTIYNKEGSVIHSTVSDYSKINIAKSSVISADNQRFAICSGLEPEVMEVFSLKTGTRQYKFETQSDFRRSVLLYLDKDFFYYETENSIKRFNMRKKKTDKFDFAGSMCDVKYDSKGNILILSSETVSNHDIYYLNLYAPNGVKQYYREFNKPVDNINLMPDGKFYFRLNDNIVVCNKVSA